MCTICLCDRVGKMHELTFSTISLAEEYAQVLSALEVVHVYDENDVYKIAYYHGEEMREF